MAVINPYGNDETTIIEINGRTGHKHESVKTIKNNLTLSLGMFKRGVLSCSWLQDWSPALDQIRTDAKIALSLNGPFAISQIVAISDHARTIGDEPSSNSAPPNYSE